VIDLGAAPKGFAKRRNFPQVTDCPLYAKVPDAGEVAGGPHQHANGMTASD
jgi:hypothetical protein